MVKCIECGLLAVKDEYTKKSCEADKETRETGLHSSSEGNLTPAKWTCYGNSPKFKDPESWRYGQLTKEGDEENDTLAAFKENVDCDKFLAYHPGKSPQEHEDMSFQEKMQIQQIEFERRIERRHHSNLILHGLTILVAAAGLILSSLIALGWFK